MAIELDDQIIDRLKSAALTAQRRAHAPYSEFRVGAAILTDRGRIMTGCNVENASYGLTVCAERTAIGRCVVEDAGAPVACIVVGPKPEPLTPCGACRQVLLEFNPDMPVYCFGSHGDLAVYTVRELIPHSFGADALG